MVFARPKAVRYDPGGSSNLPGGPLLRFTRTLAIALCWLALAGAACGGDPSDGRSPDNSNIPTATLPAQLPSPVIVVGGVAQPGGGSTYTIRSGDTLAGLAERFSISLEDLLAANPGINPSALQSGDTIKLPSGTEPTTPEASATGTPATEPDETPEPEPAPTEEPAPDPTNTPAAGAQTYVVESGDFPGTIAEKFGITVEELLAANPGINPTNLQIGQVLNIPPPSGG